VKSIFEQYDSFLIKLSKNDLENYEDIFAVFHYYANNKDYMTEDICCDIFSIVTFIRSIMERAEVKQSKEEYFLGYISKIRYVIEMQNIFTQVERKWKSIIYMLDDLADDKDPDLSKLSSDKNDTIRIIKTRTRIIYICAAHILGIDYDILLNFENELFDSDFYNVAFQKSFSATFNNDTVVNAYVYAKKISENFNPIQLHSARDLLIGWY
jgi:hypothetical protein